MAAIAFLFVNLPLYVYALWTAVAMVLASKNQAFHNALLWIALPHLLAFGLLYYWMVGQGLIGWLPFAAGLVAAISVVAQVVTVITEIYWRPELSRILIHCSAIHLFIGCLHEFYPGVYNDLYSTDEFSLPQNASTYLSNAEGNFTYFDKIHKASVLEKMLNLAVKQPKKYHDEALLIRLTERVESPFYFTAEHDFRDTAPLFSAFGANNIMVIRIFSTVLIGNSPQAKKNRAILRQNSMVLIRGIYSEVAPETFIAMSKIVLDIDPQLLIDKI